MWTMKIPHGYHSLDPIHPIEETVIADNSERLHQSQQVLKYFCTIEHIRPAVAVKLPSSHGIVHMVTLYRDSSPDRVMEAR